MARNNVNLRAAKIHLREVCSSTGTGVLRYSTGCSRPLSASTLLNSQPCRLSPELFLCAVSDPLGRQLRRVPRIWQRQNQAYIRRRCIQLSDYEEDPGRCGNACSGTWPFGHQSSTGLHRAIPVSVMRPCFKSRLGTWSRLLSA
jgi:hypothetical protein